MTDNPRVAIEGTRLRFAMIDAGIRPEDIAQKTKASKDVKSVSERTVRRLITDGKAELESLKAICEVLELDHEQFLEGTQEKLSVEAQRFLGTWRGFFVEAEFGRAPYLVTETIEIVQSGKTIVGRATYDDDQGPREEHFDNMVAFQNMIRGQARVAGWDYPDGIGYFQLKVLQGGDLLDGMTIFADGYSSMIEASRYIWIRDKGENQYLVDIARKEMEKEVAIYAGRKRARDGGL